VSLATAPARNSWLRHLCHTVLNITHRPRLNDIEFGPKHLE